MNIPARDEWLAVDDAARIEVGAGIARSLGHAWSFVGCERSANQPVGIFTFGDARFALVLAARAQIGFDARAWHATSAEDSSFSDTLGEWTGRGWEPQHRRIRDYVSEVTTHPRQLDFPSMLVEVAPHELGWKLADRRDPFVASVVREAGSAVRQTYQSYKGGCHLRISPGANGAPLIEQAIPITHGATCEAFEKDGFRLPTFDEWEYLCGAGAPTLFRWGDHAPMDRYPTDLSPAEAKWRREWVLSGGRLAPPTEPFAREFSDHVGLNAHGLLIGYDPYKYELVHEFGRLRGGDGGVMICGGEGFFVGWLALATAYFDKGACSYTLDEQLHSGFVTGRRVHIL